MFCHSLHRYASQYIAQDLLLWRTSTRRALSQRRHGSTFGTVLVSSHAIKPVKDLIQAIKPHGSPSTSQEDAILLLALSPAYAKHARDHDLPLSLARQLLGDANIKVNFTSITAVVDSLPSTTSIESPSEGLAYLLQSHTNAVSDEEPLRSSAQRPGSLSFDMQNNNNQRWRLQLPLSQTIFSTGLTSTLIIRTHGDQLDERYLEGITILLDEQKTLQLDCPLTQLTTYRTVGHSMGNIIRTLTSLEDDGEEPASRNLESAVAAYFKALEIPPEPVNVWALIVPKAVLLTGAVRQHAQDLVLSNKALKEIWTTQQDANAQSLTFKALLERRARLVKVLSGGGGWGKKAGLLSLDPDLTYSTRELRDDHGWQFDFDQDDDTQASVGRQIDQALGASVEEGDGIVFFIAPKTFSPALQAEAPRMLFGVAEKTESLDEAGRSQSAAQGDIKHYSDFFGVYSETGLGLQVFEREKLINKTKLEVAGLSVRVVDNRSS